MIIVHSLYFQLSSLFYIILLIIIYFSKKRLKSLENRFYGYLVLTNFFGLILDLISTYLNIKGHANFWLTFTCRLYLCYLATWLYFFVQYIFCISFKSEVFNTKKMFALMTLIYAIIIILLFILPLEPINDAGKIYTRGGAVDLAYIICASSVFICFLVTIMNSRKITSKKYFPLFALLIIGGAASVVQNAIPELLIITSAMSLITWLMYFTIENPDLQIMEELNIARERADKANSAKTDFLSNMSHEIRTPLNAIVGFSQALAEENLSEGAKEEVNDIIMSSNNLLEIVNGILDISKIEANKLELVSVEYDANTLFKEIVTLADARLSSKPLEFKVQIDPNLPPVLYGDRLRIKQVAINLLTNAIKYTKEGYFSLTVSSIIKDDVCRLIIAVEDSGIGIKPEDVDKLFSKFQRFELERNITTEGTGLGLAITKSLVELMGGKIIVQSIYGEGSKFTLFLDQRIVPKTAEELQEVLEEDTSPFIASGQRVLVVDDNKVNLKVAKRLLRDYYVDVELILSGQECLERILSGEKYDLILMDDMMPRMSGTEALRHLKNIIGFDIPVVALTANAISGMRERYLSLGFDEYLPKPIDVDQLNHVLRRFLRENTEAVITPDLENTQELNLNLPEYNDTTKNKAFLTQNGVDFNRGIELLGDMETYEMTLEDFYEEAEVRLEQINKYRDNMDMPNYAILVHSMKSDSKYLGFTKLAELSYAHEMASKDLNLMYINEHYSELIEEVNRILNVVKKYLGR